MTKPHSFQDAEYYIEALLKAIVLDVDEYIDKMDSEECTAFTRDFLELMQKWQPEAIDLINQPLEGAAHGLYLAMLAPLAFKKAYLHSNRFLAAKESIQKALEDL